MQGFHSLHDAHPQFMQFSAEEDEVRAKGFVLWLDLVAFYWFRLSAVNELHSISNPSVL